eukprot:m.95979 g.95979  ORF g.95979 m.95979 type:complete len:278 (+) comp26857_c0_seq1:134-967(+)
MSVQGFSGVRFYGASIGTKKGSVEHAHFHPDSHDMLAQLTISQVALGLGCKGKQTLQCTVSDGAGGQKVIVLCTLTPGMCDQEQIQASFMEPVIFSLAQGSGPLCISGFKEIIEDEDDGTNGQHDEHDHDHDHDHTECGNDCETHMHITEDARKVALAAVKAQLGKTISTYQKSHVNSAAEEEDLVKNYVKCAGNWEFVLKFQACSDESDLPRFKKIIASYCKRGLVKTFSKAERAARLAELEAEPEDIDLDQDEDDDDDDDNENNNNAADAGSDSE